MSRVRIEFDIEFGLGELAWLGDDLVEVVGIQYCAYKKGNGRTSQAVRYKVRYQANGETTWVKGKDLGYDF